VSVAVSFRTEPALPPIDGRVVLDGRAVLVSVLVGRVIQSDHQVQALVHHVEHVSHMA
jgi:hypothetical protein